MLILILVACFTLSWSVTCVRINYYLQSVVLTGFVFFSQFFWALRFLFRLNDSILIKFLVFQVFIRNAFVWINTVVVLSVSYCDDSLLCFVTPSPAIVFSQKSDLQMRIRRKELSLNFYINCWEFSCWSVIILWAQIQSILFFLR